MIFLLPSIAVTFLLFTFMEIAQELQFQTTDGKKEQISQRDTSITPQLQHHQRFRYYRWWLRMFLYIIFVVVGQSAATLLGRLYFDEGGNSTWMATLVQSAGFPVVIPLLFYFSQRTKSTSNSNNTKPKASTSTLVFLYLAYGLLTAGDNLMYSYGLLYLPVSTYSLLCATQLAFNALFSFFFNSQKFTPFILNSLVLLTISASLLAVNADSEDSTGLSRGKYIIGFFCTLGASATFSLMLSLVQLSFEKIIKSETFMTVLNMQFYPSFVSTCVCVVGLFGSGEWRTLGTEMKEYQKGRVSYVMTLAWTAVTWQMFAIGMLGLIFEVSSLFSNVISTLALPAIPILAVVFFHDKITGVKVVALLLAMWGFLSYIYQHYLDDQKAKAAKTGSSSSSSIDVSDGHVEIC